MRLLLFSFAVSCFLSPVSSFATPWTTNLVSRTAPMLKSAASSAQLYEPTQRDAAYGANVAQYLVDLHDAKATFDFCGGMMFQLVLSGSLRDHLAGVAGGKNADVQPVIFDESRARMFRIPGYEQSARADDVRVFHGREIRRARDAAGGMGMVLQLSLAGGDDPEGWTSQEVEGYDGWKHDVGRVWRNGDRLEDEGVKGFKEKFGEEAFTLNHRFYLHFDRSGAMWLSAEDGCEGTPSEGGSLFSPLTKLLGLK